MDKYTRALLTIFEPVYSLSVMIRRKFRSCKEKGWSKNPKKWLFKEWWYVFYACGDILYIGHEESKGKDWEGKYKFLIWNWVTQTNTERFVSVPNGLYCDVKLRWFIKTCMNCCFSYFYLRQKEKDASNYQLFTLRISIVLTLVIFFLMEVMDCMHFQQ